MSLQINYSRTYNDIYNHRYKLSKNEKKDALSLILKNIKESRISKDSIKNLKILNVGTGREAYCFLKLKVKKVELVDLSKKIEIFAKYWKKKYPNFNFQVNDFCKKEIKLNTFNYLYLNGVFHHFHDPKQAIKNIINNSNIGAKFFFRIYRSGSIKFFIIDFIRKFINTKNQKEFTSLFKKKWGITKLEQDASHTNPIAHFYEMCVDNFFVQDLNLFDINSMIKNFKKVGLKKIFNSNFQNYDHSVNKKDSTGFSIIFQKIQNNKEIKNLKKFKIIDQISGIKYKEYFINNTNKIILKALPTIKKFSSKKRIELAIDLLFICQGYRIFKYYNHQKKFKKYFKLANLYSTPKKIHLHIQKRILG
jgi:SAM-dependent methyltransferase